ncbi:5-formyltetrahydrofolate cyclo-ligase [Nocardiopsis sp. HNM0947]|uniref:5-formyltetrahydrofolate cyclo-ligase n=1 Tax=Nocardiopsis coralli TaxID=2772213 RepID=A0ABR9P043_9ACTN|nr:5-formyltetrahydrofolate cyclo-ligase [Nocardiopsis coralli]MBE2997198.1 5-formyltetrahydrofolate cyclo-ligase [Nocardiopsis coralli]
MNTDIIDEKNALRRRVWERLDEAGIGRTGPVTGKIPNFTGAGEAASRLSEHPRWRGAGVVKANPDKAQHEVRTSAVNEGRLLYMAVPKIAGHDPFYLVDPADLGGVSPDEAVTGRGAAEHAPRTRPELMRSVDVILCGSVAASTDGVRIGKGAGYSDIEMALLAHAGLVTDDTLIVTTVHDLQVLDEPIPESGHDVSVDLIITPTRTITCPPRRRPSSIHWSTMPEEKIQAIPALAALRSQQQGTRASS